MKNDFERLLNEVTGGSREQKAPAVDKVAQAKAAAEEAKAEAERLQRKAEELAEAAAAEAKRKKIVISYVPEEGDVVIEEGGELEKNEDPHNVIALFEAGSMIIAKRSGVNKDRLCLKLLETLSDYLVADIVMRMGGALK